MVSFLLSMIPTHEELGAKIVVAAARFVGLTEVRSNDKWDDLSEDGHEQVADELRAELLRVGWQSGWPYCAAFCEVCWRIAYRGLVDEVVVGRMLNPSCLQSWRNAVDLGWASQKPTIGSIGVMQKGDSGQGHAYIVRGVKDKQIATIEANTSPMIGTTSQDREGDGVYCKKRQLVFKPTTGLHLIGFINPLITQ